MDVKWNIIIYNHRLTINVKIQNFTKFLIMKNNLFLTMKTCMIKITIFSICSAKQRTPMNPCSNEEFDWESVSCETLAVVVSKQANSLST